MKLELQQKLFKECPELFKFHNCDGPPYHAIKFGIDTEDGWYDIIFNLCFKLESVLKTIPEKDRKEDGVVQIKEKFGGLRFYMYYNHEQEQITDLINAAEELSFKTCEHCGDAGKLITTRRKWLLTLCPKCEEKVNS